MPFATIESLFTASTLLWIVAAVVCAAALFGSMNRRRSRLTESLRDYVDRHKPESTKGGDEGPDS
jgi:beta-lactamase regulating signal transducer with metallopeptidase domain